MARNNECIEERANSYRVKIAYYEEGIRKFYSCSFSFKKYGSKQKALEYAKKHRDEKKVQLQNGIVIKAQHYTLDEVFNNQMELYEKTLATKKKVLCSYNKYIRSFIGGDREFSTIKFDDIQKNLNSMVDKAKDDTIARVKAIWVRLYKYAIAKDIVIKDETYNIQIPKSNILTIKKPMVVSEDDFFQALGKINSSYMDYREKQLVIGALLIMRYEGMRPSEVFGLAKSNIDLEKMMIYVCQRVGSTSTENNVITHPKTESSIRYIPIDDRLIKTFNLLFGLSEGEYIFKKNNGEFMSGDYLSDILRHHTKGQLRAYTLRHQFSTDMIINGVDMRTIQELMGHTSSTMTLGYARSNDELKRKAIENRKFN